MELRDYLKVLRRRWLWIVGAALLCAALAAGYTSLQTKQYSSTARLFVSTTNVDDTTLYQGGQFAQTRVQSYADLVTGPELAATVIHDLGLDDDPSDLASRVRAEVAVSTVNLSIVVTDTDPHEAQRIAQGYAEAMTDTVRQLETPEGETASPVKATIVESASYSAAPVSPKPRRNVGAGLVVGALLGFGVAVLRQTIDTRLTSSDDLAELTDRPVLGAIGFDPASTKTPLVSEISSHSPRAEAYRVLRTNLQFVEVDNPHRVIVITSAVPNEGKTTTAVNLAISLAQAGIKTILVEGDLRRPRAAEKLRVDNALGLTSALVGRMSVTDAVQTHDRTGLDFLASGPVPPNPAELLQSNAMARLLDDLRATYDVVVIDAPPLLPVADAALLAAKADGALLVARHGKVTRDQVRHSIERLEQVGAPLLGVVLNMLPKRSRSYGYGYGYGYGNGYAPTEGRRAKRRSSRGPK